MTDDLAKVLHEVSNLKGEFRLRSGKVSHEYFDKYLFESRPDLLKRIGAAMAPLVPPGTDLLAGLELGGVPVAVDIAFETGRPLLFVRKKAKDYGTCKLAEGPPFRGRRVVVVEDVVTTGGAILDGVAALRAQGALIDDVLCVIDRESGGPDKLREKGLRLIPLFTASALKRAAGA